MPNNSEILYFEWIRKAEEDELSIKAILAGGGSPSTACFLSQQMAEKCLKGLLTFYGKSIPKIHDLFQLETLLAAEAKDIASIHADIRLLNRYYIETRYPGESPIFSITEGENALGASSRIKQFTLGKIK